MVNAASQFNIKAVLLLSVVFVWPNAGFSKNIYVDDSATGLNNGSSWVNAYKYLQDALADANSSEKPVEIWVAHGVYKPDRGSKQTLGDRTATFQLINGVSLRGGYAGVGEPDPNARDIVLYETVLNGDLSGDDVAVVIPLFLLTEPTRRENSYHIVTGRWIDTTAVLEGFTITASNCDGQDSDSWGGGITLNHAGPMIIACTITGNTGQEGSGISCDVQSSPRIERCVISGNAALLIAGGLDCWWSSNPSVVDCQIYDNWTAGNGGGMYNHGNSCPVLQDTFIWINYAIGNGGGMFNEASDPQLSKCTFIGNTANRGGGMYNDPNSSATATACTFEDNIASQEEGYGGGVLNDRCSPAFRRCMFRRNSAEWGGGMFCLSGGQALITDCGFEGNMAHNSAGIEIASAKTIVQNCVFRNNIASNWAGGIGCDVDDTLAYCTPLIKKCLFVGNRADNSSGGAIGVYINGRPTIENCTIYGNDSKYGGVVNCSASAQPTIVNSIFWANRRGNVTNQSTQLFSDGDLTGRINYSCIQGLTGSLGGYGNINPDPQFTDPAGGDYHLKSQAGRWDPNTLSWVKDTVTSPCIDAGDPMSPISYEPFPNGGRINIGAYGGTAEASKSYFGEPICEEIMAGDINGDCRIDFEDFQIMAIHWLKDIGS